MSGGLLRGVSILCTPDSLPAIQRIALQAGEPLFLLRQGFLLQ